MNKILEHILSIPKSFYVSLKYFSLKDAVKLPIMVRYNTVLLGLKGKMTNSGGQNLLCLKSVLVMWVYSTRNTRERCFR